MIRQLCMALAGVLFLATPVWASPGLCTGPVCADGITRSAKNHWQLVLRLNDQQGHGSSRLKRGMVLKQLMGKNEAEIHRQLSSPARRQARRPRAVA